MLEVEVALKQMEMEVLAPIKNLHQVCKKYQMTTFLDHKWRLMKHKTIQNCLKTIILNRCCIWNSFLWLCPVKSTTNYLWMDWLEKKLIEIYKYWSFSFLWKSKKTPMIEWIEWKDFDWKKTFNTTIGGFFSWNPLHEWERINYFDIV